MLYGMHVWLSYQRSSILVISSKAEYHTGPDNNCTNHCYEYRGVENAGRKKIGNLSIKMIWERDENFGEWSTNKTRILNIL